MVSNTVSFGFKEIPITDKVREVKRIFDTVADRYDLMNDLMSLGIHRLWKDQAIRTLRPGKGWRVLDVAAGTGDLAQRIHPRIGETGRILLYDINYRMLETGRDRLTNEGLLSGLDWVQGDAESLPFPDNSFHGVTIGFGIRNVTRIETAFREMFRVLRPGGRLMCLEFSRMAIPALRPLYDTYSFRLLPQIGHWVAGDRDAYQYLVESIRRFPDQETLKALLERCGFFGVRYSNLSGGIAAIHLAHKV
ncbi:MAG: bifunctional demethylmenaquinone methyltransferase/2-methoxy-6-polyprenyl-1,4-benzoquinol methylase UbiE [Magnetococcales bacterium]|nr:bifunctional demethylmenaquinone methyltransferase/2-methoxy-6-polyprenyl-1,4-benzoquinol methylase UbiE [Magnetococcales bacterium]